jgi:uncharacterized protein YraI
MFFKSNLTKAIGLGVAIAALSAGAAFAAVATGSASVKTGPGINFHTIDRIHAGDYVRIIDTSHGWCEVRGDADGWVNCGVLSGGRVNVYPNHPHPYPYNRGPSFSFGVGPHGPSFGFSTGPGY